ncbi:tripartite tricarboxylate transporter permease [Nocardiopsis deserti]|uniref:tripartite tricarboxylate transporter permease n=1 Tax=Nocardiopsis deserti TaxID=2605988 RepID=UPI00123984F4|nr:tripartite tricarboxylate transporter permease [Nocardiopsis deserti]
MDLLTNLGSGFLTALSPVNLMFALLGVMLGMVVGALPGINPSGAVALLLPVGATLEPTTAIIMLAATYYGGMYGGTLTSVMVNIPGDSSSVATTFDGYKMALKGQAGKALGIAAIGSFVAGTMAAVMLMVAAPPLADWAVRFGPPEFFALTLLGLTTLTALGGGSKLKAAVMGVLGLLIGTIGLDPILGDSRFTFGNINLLNGIDFLPIVIGLFGLAEIANILANRTRVEPVKYKLKGLLPDREDWRHARGPIVRGGTVGFFGGMLPGSGGTLSSLLAYALEGRVAKRRKQLGTGIVEGVAAPESANNAAATGAMIPMLTLGIPGSATTAVLLGGLMMYGIQPGPLMINENPDVFWGLVASMYIGNILLLIINLPMVPLFVKALQLRPTTLVPIVIGVALAGAYSLRNNLFDVLVVIIAGAIGYFLRQFGYPAAPLVLAMVLGPMVEQSLRQSLQMSQGSLFILLERPVSLVVLTLAALIIAAPFLGGLVTRARNRRGADPRVDATP